MELNRLLAIVPILFLFVSCDKGKHVEIKTETKLIKQKKTVTQTKEDIRYQMGDNWDRKHAPAFHLNHQTVLRAKIDSSEGKISANFIFIGKKGWSEGFFIGTVHSLESSCEDEYITFLSKSKEYIGLCTGVYEIIPETDGVIFSVKFEERSVLNELEPVQFATEDLVAGQRLKFYGIDNDDLIPSYFPLITDSSSDCMLLSSQEKRISDPDQLNPIKEMSYWSLPVSCDVKHGDSGGMFVDRSNKFVGALWTGSFPKKRNWSTQSIYGLVTNLNKEKKNLWSQFNYMIPAWRIQKYFDQMK